MSVTLTQDEVAGFPERAKPQAAGVGLRVVLAAGNDGQYVEHDLGAERSELYVRVLLNSATAASGRVVLMRGLDDGGNETFRVVYNTATRGVSVEPASGTTLTAILSGAIAWHCIEVGVDAGANNATWFVNGVPRDEVTGAFNAGATRRVQLGVIFKDTAAAGELYLDEWAMAETYIGPVLLPPVPPAGNHADDPRRWLVIYNTASADSVTWAEAYRAARQVPYANLCGLELPTTELIDTAAYEDMRAVIADYLTRNGLADTVLGLLLGYRVPGYANLLGEDFIDPTPALLHLDSDFSFFIFNPLAAEPVQRPTAANLFGIRLTARIDGAMLADALALITRATNLMQNGLGDGSEAAIWLDPYTAIVESDDPVLTAMAAWSTSLAAMSTRLPLHVTTPTVPPAEPSFSAIHDDGFFWGWSQPSPPDDFFAEPAGARVFLIQLHPNNATAETLRSGAGSNWMEAAFEAGYAAAAGSSQTHSVGSVPDVGRFFAALRAGWTLAEAWLVACPVLRDALFLAGDPLLVVPMPRAGWNLYGPARRLEEMDFSVPAMMWSITQTSAVLPEALRPPTGEQRVYVLRRVDEAGREERGVTLLRVVNNDGEARLASLDPIWPREAHWPVRVEGGQSRLSIAWDRPMRSVCVAAIALQSQTDDAEVETVEQVVPTSLQREALCVHALPIGSTCYRFLITDSNGLQSVTPWSAPVTRSDAELPALILI